MKALANANGAIMPVEQVQVSVLDRAFLFGDAIYEALRVYQGKPFLLDEHFARLERSLEAIRLRGIDLGRLRRRMFETIAASQFKEAVVYFQVTRGAAPRKHAFPKDATPFELIWVEEYEDHYAPARREGTAVITHPDIRWDRCDIKSTNLLGNVLAIQAAAEAGCSEAILYLPDGTVTEGCHSSLFGVLGGKILTAPNSHEILPGITRALVLKLARQASLPFQEHVLRKDDLARVSELFLTGTTSEVLPVIRVDGKPVGDGKPGPVTRRLQEAYTQAVREFLGMVL